MTSVSALANCIIHVRTTTIIAADGYLVRSVLGRDICSHFCWQASASERRLSCANGEVETESTTSQVSINNE
jgi:hypothetical protein